MDGWQQLWIHIGLSGIDALAVVLSTTVLYLIYALILQVGGQRLTASPSVLSFSVMALLGALCARAMLGHSPTLVGGLIAVATLLLLEWALGHLRRGVGRTFALRGPRSTVVMVHGHVARWNLRRVGMQEVQLRTLLRRSGVHRMSDAELVILEPRGGLTVVRPGQRIDYQLVRDVRGADLIPPSLLA